MLNRTTLQGRLAAEPELRTTQSGVSVASFRVCWSEKYKETETKLFLNCTAWRGTGELVSKYFHKGQEIVVEGQLQTREWEDRDGGKRSTVELTVDKAHFCGPKQDGGGSGGYSGFSDPAPTGGGGFAPLDESDGELPF